MYKLHIQLVLANHSKPVITAPIKTMNKLKILHDQALFCITEWIKPTPIDVMKRSSKYNDKRESYNSP